MSEATLGIVFIVLALAAAWTVYKGVYFGIHGETRKSLPYFFAFAAIAIFLIDLVP